MTFRGMERAGVIALAVGAGAVAGGCNGSKSASTDRAMVRPVVDRSAVEASADPAKPASRGLGFFDELEGRGLVAQDDAFEGVLLLATGKGGESYPQRVAMAKELGVVDASFQRPAREAATIGEVSRMLVRVVKGSAGEKLNAEESIAELASMGIVPPEARPIQGLTGAQLVSMLGASDDRMRASGIGRVAQPKPATQSSDSAKPAAAPRPAVAKPPSPQPAAKPIEPGNAEPLPNVPLEKLVPENGKE